jgi:hypothetical protein
MADNEYDPDQFDWEGEDPGITLDDVGPDIVEEAIQAALDAHEEVYGWRYLKRSDVKESAGRLYRVKYYMPEEKRKFFQDEFPGYTFVWDGARGHHDHPVAHLCTELNEIEMVESMVESGEQWIDLFGNGKRDRKYKRNCINVYTLATPKDYLRYQNPGITDVLFDMEALCNPEHRLGKINTLTTTHALYYLSMENIGRLLNVRKERRLKALVHRHSKTHGELNAGEQEYNVSEDGVVTQINVATGEDYSHPTLEPLFRQFSAKTSFGGVAWTITAGGGDSYIIEFVACPNEICGDYQNIKFLKEKSWEQYSYNGVSVKKLLHWTWMSATTQQGEIVLEDIDLFEKLRRYVAGKQRSPRLKTETMNYARRLCNKADIIAIHGGGAHEIPVARMSDYVEIAFRVDAKNELDVALAFYREDRVMLGALNDYYEKGVMPKDFVAITGLAIASSQALAAGAVRVLDSVRALEKQNRRDAQHMF